MLLSNILFVIVVDFSIWIDWKETFKSWLCLKTGKQLFIFIYLFTLSDWTKRGNIDHMNGNKPHPA